MKNTSQNIIVATAISVCLSTFAALAQPNPQPQPQAGPPLDWQAKPPLHVRPMAYISPVGYVPSQIRHAYGIDRLANGGAGQVIGIVDAYGSPSAQNDLNVFSAKFGLPSTTLKIVGTTSKKPQAGWALETSLDIEWAHALAPNAKIVVAVASSASLGNLLSAVDAAVNAGATVVSMSWGGSEFSSEASYDYHFNKPNVTFLCSSGDNGSGASWPATSPSVVSVGGTSLYLDANYNVTSETAWSGSGGGFSAYFSEPSFQIDWQSSGYRAFPDVALVANPNTGVTVYDTTSYNGQKGWFQVGGTSAGSPMWAAIIALADEQRVTAGKVPLTGSDAAIYTIAGSTNSSGSLYGYFFNDVTSGSNGGFSATPKYDEVTGLGTPITQYLVPGLAAY